MATLNDLSIYDEVPCRFFKKPGPENTRSVMEIVLKRARALSIRTVLVASNSGKTAFDALDILGKEFQIIAVTHVTGFQKPNHQELQDEVRRELQSRGVTVLTAQHTFGGIGRAIRNKFGTYQVDEIVSNALKIFGQGTKVAIEIAMMAADAGLIRTDEEVIAIGGSSRGADSALVIRPSNSFNFYDLVVRETICKPSDIS
ncbi:MAG: pyruvate kinase alpha/beta domain-containing protein [Candidatus Omnitrophota bacterium]